MAPSRLWVLLLGLWLGWGVSQSAAEQTCSTGGQPFRPVDYREFTVTNLTPVAIDTAKLSESMTASTMAYVSVEDATIRFRFSGVPTQTSGHELAAGTSFVICSRLVIESFRAIRTS